MGHFINECIRPIIIINLLIMEHFIIIIILIIREFMYNFS